MGQILTVILVTAFIGYAIYFLIVHLPNILRKQKEVKQKKETVKKGKNKTFKIEDVFESDPYKRAVECAKTASNMGCTCEEAAQALNKMGDIRAGTIIDVTPREEKPKND